MSPRYHLDRFDSPLVIKPLLKEKTSPSPLMSWPAEKNMLVLERSVQHQSQRENFNFGRLGKRRGFVPCIQIVWGTRIVHKFSVMINNKWKLWQSKYCSLDCIVLDFFQSFYKVLLNAWSLQRLYSSELLVNKRSDTIPAKTLKIGTCCLSSIHKEVYELEIRWCIYSHYRMIFELFKTIGTSILFSCFRAGPCNVLN